MEHLVILSGCSGGGKSTLLDHLAGLGCATIPEPGRRIIAEERATGGAALPWNNLAAFAQRAIDMALADRENAHHLPGPVFVDRGLVDAAAALDHVTGGSALADLGRRHRYHSTVFLTPPWPELYEGDADRRHGFALACAEYDRLCTAYQALDYDCVILPFASVTARAAFVLDTLRTARTASE